MFVLKSCFMKMFWSCLPIVGLVQPSWSGSACCVLSAQGLLCHLQGRTNPPSALAQEVGIFHPGTPVCWCSPEIIICAGNLLPVKPSKM